MLLSLLETDNRICLSYSYELRRSSGFVLRAVGAAKSSNASSFVAAKSWPYFH